MVGYEIGVSIRSGTFLPGTDDRRRCGASRSRCDLWDPCPPHLPESTPVKLFRTYAARKGARILVDDALLMVAAVVGTHILQGLKKEAIVTSRHPCMHRVFYFFEHLPSLVTE